MGQSIAKRTLHIGLLFTLLATNAWAGPANSCFVTGDTSGNNPDKPLGSALNPYGSLAAVEADADCEKIIVQWSGTELDGGILLKPGQMLEGARGPNGELPVITNNSVASNSGFGVTVAGDNVIRHIHVLDAWASGVGGFFADSLTIHKSRVSGSGQSGDFTFIPGALDIAWPNVFVGSFVDAQLIIKDSTFGDSDGASIRMTQLDGYGEVRIDRVTVSNQGDLTADGFTWSPGIAVVTFGPASVDVNIRKTTVDNIGRGFSNSDGIALINFGSGDFTAEVKDYTYSNPDGDGGGSATGMEIGLLEASAGTFTATVENSVIDSSNSCGIQVLDLGAVTGGNRLEVLLEDNLITNSLAGVCGWQDEAPLSDFDLTLVNNQIHDSILFGVYLSLFGPNSSYEVFMQRNTVSNSGDVGLLMARNLHDAGSYNVDAGLGALGSDGQNRIIGSGVDDVVSIGMDAAAANNWWGSASGPSSVIELDGATVVVDPFLTEDPE